MKGRCALVATVLVGGALLLPSSAAATHKHVLTMGNGNCVILAPNGGESYVTLPDAALKRGPDDPCLPAPPAHQCASGRGRSAYRHRGIWQSRRRLHLVPERAVGMRARARQHGRAAWLVALPVAAASWLTAHCLAYVLVPPAHGGAMHDHMEESHNWFASMPVLVAAGVTVLAAGLVLCVGEGLRGGPARAQAPAPAVRAPAADRVRGAGAPRGAARLRLGARTRSSLEPTFLTGSHSSFRSRSGRCCSRARCTPSATASDACSRGRSRRRGRCFAGRSRWSASPTSRA